MQACGDVGYMEPCVLDDEMLGLAEVIKVMPDTWFNIPFQVTEGFETMKKQIMEQRRMIEQIKQYTMETIKKIIRAN